MSHNTKTLYFKPRDRDRLPYHREFAIVKISAAGIAHFTRIAAYLHDDPPGSPLSIFGEDNVKSYLSDCGWVPCSYEEVVRGRLLWNN